MKTIIRRYRRRYAVSLGSVFAAVILALALALAWIFMAVWTRGGPQPVHPIVIAIPAPQMPVAQMLVTRGRA